jgi:hypothetical protein
MMELKMTRGFGLRSAAALLLLCSLSFCTHARAQSDATGQKDTASQGKKGKSAQQQAPAATPPPTDANPFPGDITNVPVMPTTITPDVPPASPDSAVDKMVAPFSDLDPVKSPDATDVAADTPADIVQGRESSSDNRSMDSLLPSPGDDEPTGKGKRGSNTLAEPPKETSKEDISVGNYYLDNKNWKAARSRFQSAMVLAPDEPEIYWGLAEADRHLGNFAEAKENYQKVVDYDPDSKHGKEAKKALKDPEIANAAAAK